MRVSIEAGQGLERRLTVALPAERIDQEIQTRLQNLARTAKIAGFRPGKVPLKVVQQRFGKQVRGEVLGDLMQSSLNEAINQEQLRPVSGPTIESKLEGEGLEYVATFEIFPEFELAPVEGFKVEKPVAEVTEQDIDEMLQMLRRQRTQWVKVDRPAREGDRVTIDYSGTVPEQEEKIEARCVPIILGSKALLPEFEQQLTGTTAGDERQVSVAFPVEHDMKNVAGKTVDFTVKVTSVEEPQLPEIDEAFAASFGVKEGGVEALRQEVAANMHREMEQVIKGKVKTQVMDLLLAAHPIELPRALVKKECERLQQRAGHRAHPHQERPTDESLFEEQARRRVALGLILGEIIKRHGIKPDTNQVRATVSTIASTYEDPEAITRWIYGNRAQLTEIESMVVEDQVVDWVLTHAQVQEVPMSFKALMNRQPAQVEGQIEGRGEGVST
jgi:trigger factor